MIQRVLVSLMMLVFAIGMMMAQTRPMYRIVTVRAPMDTVGAITVRLFPTLAPKTVRNFDSIARAGRFDNSAFHRVIPDFMIQGGDPNSISGPENTWGYGDPSQPKVVAEFNSVSHTRGRLSMARSNDLNSATSQFFICHANPTFLDKQYTVFGETMSGLAVIDTIALSPRNSNDRPLKKISMYVTYVGEDTVSPTAPLLRTPIDSATRIPISSKTTFEWLAADGALQYRLEVSADTTFASGVLTATTPGLTQALQLTAGSSMYYWRVVSDNGGGVAASSSFSFMTGVGTPTALYPLNGALDVPIAPVIKWSALSVMDVRYQLQVCTKSTFLLADIFVNDDTLTSADSYVLRGLVGAKKYFWRVRAIDGADTGVYSPKFSFTTENVTDVAELSDEPRGLHLTVSPNPAVDRLLVSLATQGGNLLTLRLVDLQGRTVLRQEVAAIAWGTQSMLLNVSAVAPGVYTLQASCGGISSSVNVIHE